MKHIDEKQFISNKNFTIRPEIDGTADSLNVEFEAAHDTNEEVIQVASSADPRRLLDWSEITAPDPMTPDKQESLDARADAILENWDKLGL